MNGLTIPISGKIIIKYEHERSIVVDSMLIRFTLTEFPLFKLLLDGSIITDAELIQAFQYKRASESEAVLPDEHAKNSLEKHIDNIRDKIRPAGLDIFRVIKLGYVLRGALPESSRNTNSSRKK